MVSSTKCSYPLSFPGGSDSKESAYNAGDSGLIPRLGRFPGEGNSLSTMEFLLGELDAQRSLVGYSLRGCKELDTTER